MIVLVATFAAACGAPRQQSDPATLAQPALPMEDGAGNRMEALTQAAGEPRWCSADGAWCVEAGAAPRVVSGERTVALPTERAAESAVWPVIVRFAEGGEESALVGLALTTHQMYSGGSADATHLSLFAIPTEGSEARHVLTLPASGVASIRACFDEEDEQSRRGACVDEYRFETRVTLDETTSAGDPRLVLETAASTYPGRRSRQEDSSADPPLSETDLVWTQDETCSYRRTFTRGEHGAYVPQALLPACEDYLEP
jgi:hypothetical protein